MCIAFTELVVERIEGGDDIYRDYDEMPGKWFFPGKTGKSSEVIVLLFFVGE
jgi:hypothetical protein